MLLNPERPCPVCGAIVPNGHPVGRPYRCEGCGAQLQISLKQAAAKDGTNLSIAAATAWLLGFRGWALLSAALLSFLVLFVFAVPLWEQAWPAHLELYRTGRRGARSK